MAIVDLNLLWEGCREHHGLANIRPGHVVLFHDSPNLWLETHVKHTVGLVKAEVLAVLKADLASFQEVDKTARCGN